MTDHVRIVEVGPRDGLQNEKTMVPTADKIALIDQLSECGFTMIEATSFVSPKWVPQMADAAEVMAGITRGRYTTYCALTPNSKGLEAALAADVDKVAVFASASEGFSRANINCSIEESIERFKPILEVARLYDVDVRGYISCVTDCPYDGPVDPGQVAWLANTLISAGCFEVSLGDTIGAGTPESVGAMLDAVLRELRPEDIAGHFHDTNGRALDNIAVSLDKGVRVFDASVGGLGGCPYAPGAAGNVATEAVVEMLHQRGFKTGIDLDKLTPVARFARGLRTAA